MINSDVPTIKPKVPRWMERLVEEHPSGWAVYVVYDKYNNSRELTTADVALLSEYMQYLQVTEPPCDD